MAFSVYEVIRVYSLSNKPTTQRDKPRERLRINAKSHAIEKPLLTGYFSKSTVHKYFQ